MKLLTVTLLASFLLTGPVLHASENLLSPADQAALAGRLLPSLVRVEFELKPDRGDRPEGAGLIERCPNCGRHHVNLATGLLEEDRPLELVGFLVRSDTVLIPEVQIHPRFVRAITVRAGNEAVPAQVSARAVEQPASLLRLEKPLNTVRPLSFNPQAPPPYALASLKHDAGWQVSVQPVPSALVAREHQAPFVALPASGLICALDGTTVGASLDAKLPLGDHWKGNPADTWAWHDAESLASQAERIRQIAERSLLRVRVRFRAPPQTAENRMMMHYRMHDEPGEAELDRNGVGMLLADRRILVLLSLRPGTTARLERIMVHPADGEPVEARFVASLKDHGLLLAELADPLPEPAEPAELPVAEWPTKPLWLAQVDIQGETRIAYFGPVRVEQIGRGPKHRLYPELRHGLPHGFLFDSEGRLLAVPVQRRQKPSAESHYYFGSQPHRLTPLVYLTEAVGSLADAADPANVPLSEQDASRLAWAGIELQGMTPELARAHGVSHQTRNGESGAIVTAVHPDSPAADGNVEVGWVLLRIHSEGEPNPIDIRLDRGFGMEGMEFPWDELDRVPAEYFDRLPPPWPSADSSFNRLLAQLGRGSRYTAEFYADGQLLEREFVVVVAPPHFDSAPQHNSQSLGLSVKDLTFEVRRYLNLGDADPGVVIARVEPGGKAAVAGVRPYEVITHINDQSLATVADLQRAVTEGGDLRLAVTRMSRSRVVNLRAVSPE